MDSEWTDEDDEDELSGEYMTGDEGMELEVEIVEPEGDPFERSDESDEHSDEHSAEESDEDEESGEDDDDDDQGLNPSQIADFAALVDAEREAAAEAERARARARDDAVDGGDDDGRIQGTLFPFLSFLSSSKPPRG